MKKKAIKIIVVLFMAFLCMISLFIVFSKKRYVENKEEELLIETEEKLENSTNNDEIIFENR